MALTDHELLRRYVAGSQDAFAELVRRHLDLVYSAARRQSRSPQMAEEVAQSVFLKLSVSAQTLDPAAPLAAWLFLVTRHTAIDAARQDARRLAREAAALELSAMNSAPSSWSQIDPLLDEAMEALPAADRTAILLRYFENKSLREVGAALGSTEDAAQKRVSRAVEELRAFLSRRGVAVSAAGLATGLATTAVQAAPVSLAASIAAAGKLSGSALHHAVTSSSARTLTMTTVQKTLVAATLVAALGATIVESRIAGAQAGQIGELERRIADAQRRETQSDGTRREAAGGMAASRGATGPGAGLANSPEDAGFQAAIATLTARTRRLQDLFEEMPERKIPELALLKDDDWVSAAKDLKLDTDLQIRAAFNVLRSKAKNSAMTPAIQRALAAYELANPGTPIADINALAPYFDPPMPREILARYTTNPAEMSSSAYLVAEKASAMVDEDYDTRLQVGLHGSSFNTVSRSGDIVRAAMRDYAAATNGGRPANPQQLAPYLAAPVPEARVQEVLDGAAGARMGFGVGGLPGAGLGGGGGGRMIIQMDPKPSGPADQVDLPGAKAAP